MKDLYLKLAEPQPCEIIKAEGVFCGKPAMLCVLTYVRQDVGEMRSVGVSHDLYSKLFVCRDCALAAAKVYE